MNEIFLREGEDHIKLVQAIKKAGLVSLGSEANEEIKEGHVTVNSETELRRGRKLYKGDIFVFNGKQVLIKS